MLFRPARPWLMWDSWLFEWQGTFHLFYAERHQETRRERIAHLVSADLVRWQPRPSIPVQGKAGEWDHGAIGGIKTGMVVHHAGQFYMLIGATHKDIDLVGVHTSSDLDNWTPYPGNPVMGPQGPHYLARSTPPLFGRVDWRDPAITFRQDTGTYHAVLCARAPVWGHESTGAVVAHVRSEDLIHWEHLPPIDAPTGQFYGTEVPEIFELDGRHYLLFAASSRVGIQLNTATREQVLGTVYMIGERFEGPYALPADYLLIGSGYHKSTAWCGRTIPYQDGRLLYHHIQADPPTFGAPKRIRTDEDGRLYLQYMPVLEELETGVLCQPPGPTPCFEVEDFGDWRRQEDRLVGKAAVMRSTCRIARDVADLHLTCRIWSNSCAQAGLILRSAERRAVLIALNFERQRLEIGIGRETGVGKFRYHWLAGWGTDVDPDPGDGPTNKPHPDHKDDYRCSLAHGRPYPLRCFARDEHFEVYLDDRWVFTAVFDEAAKSGDVELFVERGEASFSDLRLANIEPLA